MSWILLKANNGQQASGVGDKRFFRFKRNLWTAIFSIILMILHINKSCISISYKKFVNIFKIHLKNFQCFGALLRPFHFLSNMPVMTQRTLTGPTRVEWLWVNDFIHNKYHIWHAWPSTCWHVGNKLLEYEVRIFTAQTCNHWRKWKGRAVVPKNGLPNWCDWILCQCQ